MTRQRIALAGLAVLLAAVLLLAVTACSSNSEPEATRGVQNPPVLTGAPGNFDVVGDLTVAGASEFQDSVRLTGVGTDWEDLRIDGLSTRTGVVAPTDEAGFRGSASFLSRNFVHTQADEVQFTVQMPHAWREGSDVFPHVHFSPWVSSANTNTVQLKLDCFAADVSDTFPAVATTYVMSTTWVGEGQWDHLIAANDVGLDMTGLLLSSLMKCRLYRDNTVDNNYAAKIAFLYFDIHYEADSFGSNEEYVK